MSYLGLLPHELKRELLYFFTVPELLHLFPYDSTPFDSIEGLESINDDRKYWVNVVSKQQNMPVSAFADYTIPELKLILEFPIKVNGLVQLQHSLKDAISTKHTSMALYLLDDYATTYVDQRHLYSEITNFYLPYYKLAIINGQYEVLKALEEKGFDFDFFTNRYLPVHDRKRLLLKAIKSKNIDVFKHLYRKLSPKITDNVEFNRELLDSAINLDNIPVVDYFLSEDLANADWTTYVLQVGWHDSKITQLLEHYKKRLDKGVINEVYKKAQRHSNKEAEKNILRLK